MAEYIINVVTGLLIEKLDMLISFHRQPEQQACYVSVYSEYLKYCPA